MTTRATAHAIQEKAVFAAFLAAHPSIAAAIHVYHQPVDEFPDIIAMMDDGTEVDFELAEWLDGAQMAAAKRYDALAVAMLEAIGPHDPTSSRPFRAVMLSPRRDVPVFAADDRVAFREGIEALIQDTDRRWASERFWHSPQGRICRELEAYQALGKYLRSVTFDPLVVAGKLRPWPAGQPWIFVQSRVGSYSPDTATLALVRILERKLTRYGRFTRRTWLLVYYGKAVAYNTPYLGIHTREFGDMAALAAGIVREQPAFERVYLLNAVEPKLELYEIYPTCGRCA